MEPENTPLQKENHRIQTIIFRFELLIFGGVHIILQLEVPFILKPSPMDGMFSSSFFRHHRSHPSIGTAKISITSLHRPIVLAIGSM